MCLVGGSARTAMSFWNVTTDTEYVQRKGVWLEGEVKAGRIYRLVDCRANLRHCSSVRKLGALSRPFTPYHQSSTTFLSGIEKLVCSFVRSTEIHQTAYNCNF